jgi:tetratricopeptide (TPR) repeat protein
MAASFASGIKSEVETNWQRRQGGKELSQIMTVQEKNRFKPLSLLINSAAIGLACVVLTMDASAFIFWVSIGVFDGHWNDISLQVLFVCMVISFVFFLLVAAMFGVANKLALPNPERVQVLTELGHLIDSGWERALRISTSCSLVVLSLLAFLCLSFWRDLLWWSEVCRAMRATTEARLHDATDLYEASIEIATSDRKPISLVMVADSFFEQKKNAEAERYFLLAIDAIKGLPNDNRSLLTTAYQGLARAYMNQGKYVQAEAVLRQCVAVFGDGMVPLNMVQIRLMGSVRIPNPNAAPTMWGTLTLLQQCCIKQNRFDDAKKAFEQNLAMVAEQTKMDSSTKLATMLEVTDLYVEMLCDPKVNRVDFVDMAYKAAQKSMSGQFGNQSLAVAKLQLQYADRLKSLNLPEKAKQEYLGALAIYRKDAQQGDFSALKAMNNLAGVYAAEGENEKAEALYKEELDLAGHWHPQSSDVQIQVDTCRADYANLLHKLNRDADAKRIQAAAAG